MTLKNSTELFEHYRSLAYRYLAIRSRSEKEIRDYLNTKKASTEIINKLLTLLKQQKFLDDEAFAKSWIRSRARLKPKGKQLLKFELQRKGITKEIINKVLTEENEEIPDELTQAKRLVEKKIEKLKDKPKQEIYHKAGSFLARRGFSWEISKKAIDAFL